MVLEKVKGLIAEQFGVNEDEITPETSFAEDLNADSLDFVELVMAIEAEFDITIEDEVIEHISTVDDVVNQIKKAI